MFGLVMCLVLEDVLYCIVPSTVEGQCSVLYCDYYCARALVCLVLCIL